MVEAASIEDLLASVQTESGTSLLALTQASPVLLIFLRHFGCSFCRQTISQIAELQQELEARGVRPVFVHLGTPEIAKAHFDYYGLGNIERIHDPQAALYRHPAFGLRRTNAYSHVFRPKVIAGWLMGGAIFRHGIGKIQGDGEQMPGLFFLRGPVIVRSFVHRSIADQSDYLALVS
jgi:thiol-disulfide isomerase/thioredoxin